ncbi:STAS domain-containing protein [Modestobacter sp. VKM Ac-2979]|uniref:STAS domain-containing protein n=1 Tax=unclassified Modestobacter TaxID=2643866 RepID=UPI0022ABB7E1|nr:MULTISPECIES: STAS domain-containing protein [unclassified Modestobacter]MCZ2811576.1 STAS domain-containing protein [Modestobacter sp. VKM Ac-2979]MCZ2843299.1 STAS domain-containing protein [Modestobacter sp. VKM Ac-2980]
MTATAVHRPPTGTDAAPARPGRDGQVVVRLSDDLLADGLADLRWLLHDALLSGARRLVVDLTDVRQLSSTAVASFLWAHRTCRARGGAVVLRGVNRRTEDLLHRTGLWRVMQLEDAPHPPEG